MFIISKWAIGGIHIEGKDKYYSIENGKVIHYNHEKVKEIDFISLLEEMAKKEHIYILTKEEIADFAYSSIMEEC